VGLFVEFLIVLGTGWFLVLKQENIRLEELERKRQQVEARKAAQRAAEDGEPLPELPEPIDKPAEPAFREMEFRFRFAWKESLIALLIAAALLTVMQWVGGPEPAALLIGGLAAVGLCLHWFGIEPPAIWILGWWILLALYIVAFLCGLLAVAEEAKATPIVQVQRWNAEETPVQVKPSAVSYQPSAFPASFSPRAEG
jgi:hypothetical protein